MKNQKVKRSLGLLALALIPFLLSPAAVTGQKRCWTSVGSTGTVDEADLGAADISGDHIALKNTVTSADIDIRYNILAVDGLFGGDQNTKNLAVRMVDNGDAAQVVVEVRALNLATGASEKLVTLDSNDFDPHFQAKRRVVSFNCQDSEFDFKKNLYYIAVKLRKTGAGGTPLIRGISICGDGLC